MANFIEWKEEYSLGIHEIDTQHKKIFAVINDFYCAVEQSKEKEGLPIILGELVSFAEYHFSVEEKHFEEFDFEGKRDHIDRHNIYRKKVAQFLEKNEREESGLSWEILDFMKEWWMDHITGVDRLYVECFHKHGLY